MPVRIVTDSSCDLSADDARALGIEIVPLSIRFGSEEFTDGVDLSTEEFYTKMASTEQLPETAAPSPGAFEEAFRRQAQAGADAIVCVNLSSKLSATMQSAQNAAKSFEDDVDVRVIDSSSISTGLGTLVRRAAMSAEQGADADAIEKLVTEAVERTHVIGALDTLDNLKKGGRIGGLQAAVGSLLSIKPLVDISTGEVAEAGKARTRRKALQWLRDRIVQAGDVEDLHIVHGGAQDVDVLLEMIKPHHSADVQVRLIGPVIGTHGGPGVMGATWLDPQ